MPTLLQASISSVPAGAVTFLPSTVMFTSAIKIFVRHWQNVISLALAKPANKYLSFDQFHHFSTFKGTRLTIQVIFKFLSEFLHDGNCRHGGGVAEWTEGASQHVFRKIADIVDILLNPAPG